ncbi:MAG: aminopeptidase [Treponema sp.]
MNKEISSADNVIKNVCKVKKNERVLIIANPETGAIAQDLYTAASNAGGRAVLMFQNAKSSFDDAEIAVIAAIASNPDVCISLSAVKLGKDANGRAKPYKTDDGREFDHIFDFLLGGKKSIRAVWAPGITQDMFTRTVNIDYAELKERCEKLGALFDGVEKVHVKAAGGTDIMIPVQGRKILFDDGDFSKAGSGGNIPAGEVFISPVVGSGNRQKVRTPIETLKNTILGAANQSQNSVETEGKKGAEGVIVFDGSMTFSDGDALLETPITCTVEEGFVTDINGGAEAKRLLKTVTEAENRALALEAEGKLPQGQGVIYRRNARNIGELGIGLNPAAMITGNMLEDEKAFGTCHFAVGENYDNDAPSLIHLDGLVRNPTITLFYGGGSQKTVMTDGKLQLQAAENEV